MHKAIGVVVSCLVTAAIGVIAPAAASAGPLVASADDCDDQPLSQPFEPWLDPTYYTPLAGGDFERGSDRWSRAGGAVVVDGNEPFQVAGARDSRSLSLPDGSTATSPAICVGLDHPTVRLFASPAGLGGTAQVEVLFEDAAGNVNSAPIGTIGGGVGWNPTAPLPVLANLLPLLPGDLTAVAFRFSADGAGVLIDDIYVDPRHSS
jgi:hypothetical protein